MRFVTSLGLTALALSLSTANVRADDVEDVLSAIEKKWSKYTSVSANVNMDMVTPMGKAKSTGKMMYMRNDDKELSRTELTIEMDMGGQKMTVPQMAINDGEYVYNVVEMMGQKTGQKSKPKGMDGSLGGADMLRRLKDNHELKVLDTEKIDGEDMFVIEATPNEPESMGPQKFTMYIAKKDGVPRKYVGVNGAGEDMMTMTISDVKFDEKLDAALFVPPTDVTFIDMGGQ